MGFQANCNRCYAKFECYDVVYCNCCKEYNRTVEEKKALEKDNYRLQNELQNSKILNQNKLSEKDEIINNLTKKLEEDLRKEKENAEENLRDFIDNSQSWHQRVENELRLEILTLKKQLNLEITEVEQLKEAETELLVEELFIS